MTSAPGVGSTFSFTVPLRRADLSAAASVERYAPILQRRRLLVVDDNASAGSILAQLARGFGMAVQQVDSGPAALAQLGAAHYKGRPFDMVLMDWRMPGMDGIQAARQIKAHAAWASIPVVLMVTAYARDTLLTEAQNLGLAGVLIKPVTEPLVFRTLVDALGRTWTGPPSTDGDSPLDQSHLQQRRVLLLAERPLDHEQVVKFLQKIGMHVDTAIDSAQAMAQLQVAPYDVVLVSHHMPGMDGLAATRRLRSEPRWAHLPVLGLVALVDGMRAAEPQACREAGMDDSLPQPVDFEQLSRLLVQWLPKDPTLAALAGLRVLVVDDNALNREVASEFLQAVRMQVVLASDGQQALDCLAHRDFDMVLMDLQMPVMDGLAASREIRKQARWANLPLIALTAHDSQVGHPAAVAAGMNAYLRKPIDESLLHHTLLQFVPQPPRSMRLVAADAPADSSLPADLPGVDLRLALVRLGGRPASLQRMLSGFVRDFASLPAQWRRPGAVPSRNAIISQVHTLKSTARYLGADALADAAVHLEQLAPHATPKLLAEAVAVFCQQLDTVLDSAMGLLVDYNPYNADVDAGSARVDVAAVLTRIATAQPMVMQGNYAAAEQLLDIRSALALTALARLADTALTQFEDLNLSAASGTLQVLAEALADNHGHALR